MRTESWLFPMSGVYIRLRWSLLAFVALVFNGCAPSEDGAADASTFPSRPITLICPWGEGGGTDRLSRFMASQLESHLGKPVQVVNRTGGGGAVGHRAGAEARPDGHTVLMGTFELSTMRSMGLSPLSHEDYVPLMQLNADAAAFIVAEDSALQSVDALISLAKREPGRLKFSGTAAGGAWDLARVGFQLAVGLPVDAIVWTPTDGSAASVRDLLGGHIDGVCVSLPEASSQIESGALRPLAVMSAQRLDDYPECPTLLESGVEWTAVGWRGVFLPKETPPEIVESWMLALREITQSEAFTEFMARNQFAVAVKEGAEFEAFLAEQDQQWKEVIEAGGFAP